MVLNKTDNEAFIPLLEDYFNMDIIYREERNAILKYHYLVNKKLSLILDSEWAESTLSIGLKSYLDTPTNYLFIWEVKDVIELCRNPHQVNKWTIIICNLETHFHELILLGFQVESVYKKLGRNIPLIEKKDGFELLLQNKSGVVINPTSLSGDAILNCKALIKYRDIAFKPNDNNYSNEFCEVYQMAAILGIDVYTTTNEHEIEIIINYVKRQK